MNTNGWDTVFAARVDRLNEVLASSTGRLIQEFSFSEQGCSVSGRFGQWSIEPGGAGELLMLQIAIDSGVMALAPNAPGVDLGGMAVVLQVGLQLLPDPAVPSRQTLSFDFRQAGTYGGNSGSGVVSPHDVHDGGKLTLLQKAALGNAVADCLVSRADEVSFVFATINPMQAAGVPWMHPVHGSYCYFAPPGGAPVMAILGVTTDRDISGLPRVVDPAVLQGNGNAGLAISPALFLQNVLAPALKASLGTSGSFVTGPEGILRNASALPLAEVDRAGERYYPQITSLTAVVLDTQVVISSAGDCDMHMGVSMSFNSSSNVSATFDPSGDTVKLAVAGAPTFHHDVSIPWYDHLFDIISAGLAEAILQICVAAISSELGSGIAGMTSAGHLVAQAPSLVDWAGSSGFTPMEGSLATSFYLRGRLA